MSSPPHPDEASFSPGFLVGGGRFTLMRLLGRGGMGVVYKAHQFSLNRTVALKMVLAGGRASTGELARFRGGRRP